MRRLLAHIRRRILERLHERFEDRRIAKLHEGVHRGLADFLVGVLQRGGERCDHPRIGGCALRLLRIGLRGGLFGGLFGDAMQRFEVHGCAGMAP